MESELSDLQSSLKNIIHFLEEVPWGTGTNIYTNNISAQEDLEYLEVLSTQMLERSYKLTNQLDKQLFMDMETTFISLANYCDSAGKNRVKLAESEENGSYMECATDTMHKAKEFLPVFRELRSRLHQYVIEEELVSTIDKIIYLIGQGYDLYEKLISDEVQDLTAKLIVLGGKYKLLESNSLVWAYWGDCDIQKLRLYCDPDSEYFEDFGASLCAELRILRENARLLSSKKEGEENRAVRNNSNCSDLLESIHSAKGALEKAVSPELDLNSLSEVEMAFSDAAVIKYLTERFGEQDDGLGNWPRDWHECPEAFDLWKEKIRECLASQAKGSLETVASMAQEQIQTKPESKAVEEQPNEAKKGLGNTTEEIRPDLQDISNTVNHLLQLSDYFSRKANKWTGWWNNNDSRSSVACYEKLHWFVDRLYGKGVESALTLGQLLQEINVVEFCPRLKKYVEKIRCVQKQWIDEDAEFLSDVKRAIAEYENKLCLSDVKLMLRWHEEHLDILRNLDGDLIAIENSERYKIENPETDKRVEADKINKVKIESKTEHPYGEELELLQGQFEEGAKEFPMMRHHLIEWTKSGKESNLPGAYLKQMPEKKDVIKCWESTAYSLPTEHSLFRKPGYNWNTKKAYDKFKLLAEAATQHIFDNADKYPEIDTTTWGTHYNGYDYVAEPVTHWLLVLQKMLPPSKIAFNLEKVESYPPSAQRGESCFSNIEDVFLGSALACGKLLTIGHKTKPPTKDKTEEAVATKAKLGTYEPAKKLAETYGIDVRRLRAELSKEYWGPGGSKSDNPLRPQLRTRIEETGGKDTQYLWHTELVKPILEKLANKHKKKH